MKKQFAFIAVITMFLLSCTGFYDLRDYPEIIDEGVKDPDGNVISTTFIRFFNEDGYFPVDVFSSYTRDLKVNKDTISALSITEEIPWVPTKTGESYFFYLTYYMLVDEGIRIPFIPRQRWGVSSTQVSIPFNTTTTVPIYNLSTIIPNEEFLTDDVYVIIDNNYATAVQFQSGNIVLPPENINNTIINPGAKGLYKLAPTNNISVYNISMAGIRRNLPSDMTSLAAGHIYFLEVPTNGIPVTKRDSYSLTMGNFYYTGED